ncbi:hypothetical protein J6590_045687 [Homalodisca vitripennis]|nr:hypothetical protein J6590_045687 [Homalodisca vitripennis]
MFRQNLNKHGVVIEMVAFYLDEESTFVEEGILDSEQHLVIMDNFFASGGPQAIIFNCAKRLAPPPGNYVS